MTERIAEASPRVQARIAGFLYLIVIVGGIFAEIFVRGRLVVHGDAAATAHNIIEQLQAAAYMSVQLFEYGFAISLVFFGFDCLAMAYLILRSNFLPRILGVLLAIEGLGYLINSFALFLAPALQARIFPYFMATGIAEVALCLWLLVMGVNVQRWKEQAEVARLRSNGAAGS